jgi:hypothetical protein
MRAKISRAASQQDGLTVASLLPMRAAPSPLFQLQQAVGNQAVARLLHSGGIQTKIKTNQAQDKYEQEADQIADQITARPSFRVSESLNVDNSSLAANVSPLVQTKRNGNASSISGALRDGLAIARQGGQPLPLASRQLMESRFGTDLSDVRVHTDKNAAQMNRNLNANAFTMGHDIYFGAGRFQPESIVGQKLLAHELAHTLQQTSVPNSQYAHNQAMAVQKQEVGSGSPSASQITVQDIFPFPQGSRVQLNRILPDNWLDMLSSLRPQTGIALRAIENKVATVTTTGSNLFEAAISDSITLPAQDNNPAVTLHNVTLRLQQQAGGTFSLELSGQAADQSSSTTLFTQRNLTARREGGGIVLAAGGVNQLRVSGGEGQVRLETFTAPYLSEIPEYLRGLAPERLDLIQLTRLPSNVQTGTAEEQAAIEATASRIRGRRRTHRQRLVAGAGLLSGAQIDPLFGAAWQINFTPIPRFGSFLQIPLEVQLQYAPTATVLGSISSGVESSLSQLDIPINVRLMAGLAGGTIQGQAPGAGAERPVHGAFGLTAGAGLGLEVRRFRMDLRYDFLLNLLAESPNAHTLSLRFGGSF